MIAFDLFAQTDINLNAGSRTVLLEEQKELHPHLSYLWWYKIGKAFLLRNQRARKGKRGVDPTALQLIHEYWETFWDVGADFTRGPQNPLRRKEKKILKEQHDRRGVILREEGSILQSSDYQKMLNWDFTSLERSASLRLSNKLISWNLSSLKV